VEFATTFSWKFKNHRWEIKGQETLEEEGKAQSGSVSQRGVSFRGSSKETTVLFYSKIRFVWSLGETEKLREREGVSKGKVIKGGSSSDNSSWTIKKTMGGRAGWDQRGKILMG